MPDEIASDVELVTWLEERLKEYARDFSETPELVGGRYSYVGVFNIMSSGMTQTVHQLRVRAQQMVEATPWSDHPERANDWLRHELHGWRGVVLWADALYTMLANEKP